MVIACLVVGSITPASAAPVGPAAGPVPVESSESGSAGAGSSAGPDAELLVADFNDSDSVRRFALDGTAIGSFDEADGLLGAARAVEVGPDGLVYVAGADTGRIGRYDPADGSLVDVVVDSDAGLDNPRALAFDGEGRLLVASSGNDEVVSFDPDSGEPLGVVAAESLDNPGGMLVDDGLLWVTSQNTDSIVAYKPDGGIETEIDTGPGSGPVDLTLGPGGVFFVAMADGGRVDVVTLPVERPGLPDIDAVVEPFVSDGLVTPTAVSVGPDGALWVVDHWSGAIRRFDATTAADLGFEPGSQDSAVDRLAADDRMVDASFGPADIGFVTAAGAASEPRPLEADPPVGGRSLVAADLANREFFLSGRLYDAVVRSHGATVTTPGAQVGLQLSGAAPTKPGRLIAASRRGDPAEPGVDDVWFDQVLPGVDLVWTADGEQLEYSFVLAPGASVDLIDLDFDVPVTIDADGDAILGRTGLATSAPVAYQDGPTGRVPVPVVYVENADGTLGFEVGAYDPDRPLVIDPTFMAADSDTATSSSLTLATPVGANPGDVLVAAVTDGSGQTISAPAGWVTIRSDTDGSIRQTTFHRVVTTSEPATHTFTTGASSSKSGAMLAYDDVDAATPVDVHAGRTNTIGDGYLAPSVTTTVDDATLVVFYGGAVTGDVTPPAGMTERADVSVAGALTSTADEGLAAAGATGTRIATGPSSATIAHSVALRPTPGVSVNSTGDGADTNAGNGVCDTGAINSQGDPECTLRAAIQEANASATLDAIRFDIPTTESGYEVSPVAFRIQPSTVLPNITDPVVIDAATQPEHAVQGRPVVVLDGTSVPQSGDPNGLSLNAGSSTVRGLVIQNFGDDGIEIDVNGDNTIVGNYIGTDATGTLARPNGVMDVFAVAGVSIKTDGNVIGGTSATDRNLVSGSTQFGIAFRPGANDNTIVGNYIGTDATGTAAIPNQDSGIHLDGTAGSNVIGGPGLGEGNLISGNNTSNTATTAGIYMLSSNNTVQGNRIGTDASGTAGLFNDGAGITLAGGAADNLIGGTTAGTGNTIAHNRGDGVRLMSTAGSGNSILGNSIHTNEDPGLGIDLQNNAVTSNDSGDADSGTNDLLNFPLITSAVESGGTVTVTYDLDAPANPDQYRVEFFANPSGTDVSGNGEGETFLAATTTAPGTGLTHNFSGLAGDVLTATATRIDSGAASGYSSTSEFSAAYTATAGPEPVVLDDVQKGTATLSNGSSSLAVSIASVDPAKAFLTFNVRGNSTSPENISISGRLSNATTVTFNRVGTSGDIIIDWSVVEFSSGVTVQRGTVTPSGSTTNVALTAVDLTKSFPLVTMRAGGVIYEGEDWVRARLTSATNLELATNSTFANVIEWQVVTYNDAAVQSGSVSFGTGDSSRTATVTAVDPAKSWLIYNYRSADGNTTNIGQKLVRGRVTNSTTLTFDRSSTGQTIDLQYFVVTFSDTTEVRSGNANFSSSGTTVNAAISAVDPARSIGVGGYAQTGGRSAYTSNDNPGVGWFTSRLTSSTNMRVQRTAALAGADLGWFVVYWPGTAAPLVVNSTGNASDTTPGNGYCSTGATNAAGLPECTLRAAIQEANANAYVDTVHFSIPASDGGHSGGIWTITPGSELPQITSGVTLDATTQSGWTATPVVELNGTSAGAASDGLRVFASNVTIRGFAVNRFGADGIEVDTTASNTLIAGNHIGVDPSGLLDRGNGGHGVDLQTGSGPTTVGGTSATDRNIISGNGTEGILVWGSDGNTIIGNHLGTDVTGNAPIPNGNDGIHVGGGADNNIFGQAGAGNVLSGNDNDGIEIDDVSGGNIIRGNIVGLGADGSTTVANARHGVVLYNGANNTQIGGSGVGEGNTISGNGVTGIIIDGNSNAATTANIVAGNRIGVDSTGTVARANGAYGVYLFAGTNGNTIGGPAAAHGNVISGNGPGDAGVRISGATTSANIVQYNKIGTNATGTAAIANNLHGIWIDQAPNTQILDNLISGNDVHGVYVSGVGATGTDILRNTIGTNAAVTAAIPNAFDGIRLESSSSSTTIGSPGNGNVIAGNTQRGIDINDNDVNVVQGNWIGTDSTGTLDLGNGLSGVFTDAFNSSNNLIGGVGAGEGNTIAYNGEGVTLDTGTGNSILGNSIHSNDSLGIDLADNGVTANDSGDGDSGANNLLNFPVLTAPGVGSTTLDVDLDVPAGNYRIEVFTNAIDGVDPSGHGEGETLVHAETVTHTGSGVESFTLTGIPAFASGDVLTATATEDLGGGSHASTSEFAAAITVAADLIGRWRFDEGSGSTAFDSSGAGHDGTITGATYTTGVSSTGLDFTGNSGERVVVGDPVDGRLDPGTGNFTVSAWFRTTQVPGSGDFDQLVYKSDGSEGYELFLADDGGTTRLTFRIRDGGASWTALHTTPLDDGVWHHAAGVMDATNIHLYLDGTLVATQAHAASDIDTTELLAFGADSAGPAWSDYEGELDEISIYGRALSAGEVAALASTAVTVNSTGDATDATPGDDVCDTGGTNSAGDPECTLRAAIQEANASAAVDTINFAMPATEAGHAAGVWTISPGSGLPTILAQTTIDGTTQTGWVDDPIVRVDGNSAGGANGLTFGSNSDGSKLDGLMITRFTIDGVYISTGADGVTVTRSWVGSDGSGSSSMGNGDDGIDVNGINAVISDSVVNHSTDEGIDVRAAGVTITGTMVGVEADGSSGAGNTDVGIAVFAGSTTIGGTGAGQGNVISLNWEGIEINSSNNVIQGNKIGTASDGTTDRGNDTGAGIDVRSGTGNEFGGTAAGAGNVIAFNQVDGVEISGGNDNSVLGNDIHSNGGLGIDLGTTGVTSNDAGDGDSGANDLLNFPVITSAAESGGTVTVDFDLDVPAGDYRVEFFTNPSGADPSGNGEGESFVHSYSVSGHPGGSASYSTGFTGSAGDIVTATATEDLGGGSHGATSEFSAAYTATGGPASVVLDHVESGTATLSGGISTVSATIAAVDPSKSFLTFSIRGNDANPDNLAVTGELTNATTVTFQRPGTTGTVTIEWSVVEFASGVSVQRGTTNISATTTNVAISAVDLGHSFVILSDRAPGTAFGDNDFMRAELTSSTNLRLSMTNINTNVAKWQVVTYNDASVQSGTISFGTGDASRTATVSSVDPAKTWLLYSVSSANGTGSNIGQKLTRGRVTNGTTLTFDRSNTGQTMDVSWFAVEFTDATEVQHASVAFAASDTTKNVAITSVNPSRSIAVGGYKQYGGRSAYSTDDNPGVGWFTTRLTSGTNLLVERDANLATADLGWTVVHWPVETYTVNSTGDGSDATPGDNVCGTGGTNSQGADECTLRAAIEEANASGGATIHFSIPTNDPGYNASPLSYTLTPASPYPMITAPTTLDATTQSGYTGDPIVELDGTGAVGASGGLVLRTDDSTIRGFAVHSFVDEGLEIDGSTGFGDNNTLQNNWVGLDAAGTVQGNGDVGILVTVDALNNLVGGTGANDGNVVAGSTTIGVLVRTNSTGNAVLANSVYGNTGLGLDLDEDGVTANDAGDPDTGSNDLLNYPVISSATESGGTVTVTFDLDVPANPEGYRVEFFTNPGGADPSGSGEGEQFASATTVSPGTGLTHNFAGSSGDVITATATAIDSANISGYGSTSEYSTAVTATPGSATTVTFQEGTDGYTGTVDTWVSSIVADQDNSAQTSFDVDNDSYQQGLIRFDGIIGAGPGQIPSGATVTSATLTLVNDDPTSAGATLSLHRLLRTWVETDTWNTLSSGISIDGVEATVAPDATYSGPMHVIDTAAPITGLETAVQTWVDGDPNRGWLIVIDSNDGLDIRSSENATTTWRPQLEVTYIVPPLPPVAADDGAATSVDTGVVIDVLANDTDPNDDTLSVQSVTQGTNGTVVNNGSDVTYTPNSSWTGVDTFTYIVSDGNGGTDTATVTITVTDVTTGLWLSTAADVGSPSDAPGLDSWSAGSILAFTDPGLAFEPPSTAGTFSLIADLDAQGDGNVVLSGLDVVESAITVGGSPSVALQPGDLLLSTENDEDFTNADTSTTATKAEDIVLFRPQTPGDYTSGTFSVLLAAALGSVDDFSLVEQATTVGDTLLPAGSFLLTTSDQIHRLDPTAAGPAVSPGTPTLLVDGPDVAINQNIVGLHLVDDAVQVDGVDLFASDLLISIDNTDSAVGDNGISVVRQDIFRLRLSKTTEGSGVAKGTATLFFDGSDVGLDTNYEDVRGVVLRGGTPITAPIAVDDQVRVPIDSPGRVIAPLVDDLDPNGDSISLDSFTQPANGTVTDNGDKTVTYVPDPGYSGPDSLTYTITDGSETDTGTVTIDVRTVELFATTLDPVTAAGTSGLTAWSAGTVLSLGGAGLTLDPPTTSATLGAVIDFDRFADDGVAEIGGLHEMTRTLTVGSGPTAFTLEPGDLVFTSRASETFEGRTTTIAVSDSDVAVFRPDEPGEADTNGEFIFLLENPVSAGSSHAMTVVERATWVGDTSLAAGTFLFSHSSGTKEVWTYTATATGSGTTVGTLTSIIDFADEGLGDAIVGLDLVEETVTVGGRTLVSGTLLMALDNEGTLVGTNYERWDVLAVDVITTTLESGLTDATTSLLFDGSDAGFGDNTEAFRSLYLWAAPQTPVNVVVVNSTGDASDATPGDAVCYTGGVNSQGDPECSLRAAIEEANASTTVDTVEFNVPTSDGGHSAGVWTIAPAGELPFITDDLTIDATTQPGWTAAPVVELDGSGIVTAGVDGLHFGAGVAAGLLRGLSIGGFPDDGVVVHGNNVAIADNYLGLASDGTTARGNGEEGIAVLTTATGIDIVGNFFTDHSAAGVVVSNDATDVTIRANTFGTDVSGTIPLPNNGGVWSGTTGTVVVGGTAPADANTILNSVNNGVSVGGTGDVSVLGNIIRGNGGLGIDLGFDGVTANDAGDVDTGANALLNFPVILAPIDGGTTTAIELDVPAGDYRIEVFENPTNGADVSGHGEGEALIGAATVTHTGSGVERFLIPLGAAVAENDVLSATATEDLGGGAVGATSEFSAAVTVGPASLTVNSAGDGGDDNPGDGYCHTGTVNSAGDPACTLRAAIEETNAAGLASIDVEFAIPTSDGGYSATPRDHWTIAPATPLPALTTLVDVLATTQAGWSSFAPVVYLDGSASGATDLLHYDTGSTSSVVQGLGILNAPGTAIRGDVPYVHVRDVVIGVEVDGTTAAGSAGDAVFFNGSYSDIRDSVISASGGAGVRISTLASFSTVTESYIGTGTDGTGALGNTGGGVVVDGGGDHAIGLSVQDINVIAHNPVDVQINGTADGIQIENNLIGVDLAGNGSAGSVPLEINTTGSVRVGGELSTDANTIRYGTAAGITVTGTGNASIVGNSIFSNAGVGIDLGADGVTANDSGDGDAGPNGLLNFPVLSVPHQGDSILTATLDVPAGDYRIEVFTNLTEGADPSGHGEGETLLTAKTVTHAGSGPEDYMIVVPAVSLGQVFTATATRDLGGSPTVYGPTSEFSAAVTAASAKPVVLDSSGRRSDLTADGGLDPVAAETAGITGRALPFDGFGDRLQGPALNIADAALTMTARVRPDTLGGTSALVSKRTSGGSPIYELVVNGAGQASATFGIGGSVTVTGGSVSAGSWHDVVATWDGADAVLYVDGVEVDRAAAGGSLAADIDTPVTIGNRSDGSAGFDGLIDHVDITHDPVTGTEAALRHANTVAGTLTATVGQQQTGPPGPWTVTTGQSRSGNYALAAPVTPDSGSAAWAVATGIDEPGVVFESWWWIDSTAGVDVSSGTRAGASATDQFDATFIAGSDWALRRRFGATTDTDGTGTLAPATGTWVKVEQWTDQNGNSRLLVDGTEVITWTGQTSPPAGGSVGFRVGQLPGGQFWLIDDPRARKLISPEPVATLGPLDRD